MKETAESIQFEKLIKPEWDKSDDKRLFDLAVTQRALLPQHIDATYTAIEQHDPLLIARNDDGQYFVGKADLSESPGFVMDWLINKPGYGRKSKGPVSNLFDPDDIVEAEYQALLYKEFLPLKTTGEDSPTATELVLQYSNPHRKEVKTRHPEIFTFRSAFNNTLSDYPQLEDAQFIKASSYSTEGHERLRPMLRSLIGNGLTVLENETSNSHVRQAAHRFSRLIEPDQFDRRTLVTLLSSNPHAELHRRGYGEQAELMLPSPESIAFIPQDRISEEDTTLQRIYNSQFEPGPLGYLLLSPDWMTSCDTKPHQALSYLLRAASLARDHSYGRLVGQTQIASRHFGIQNIDRTTYAYNRATSLINSFLTQAKSYDTAIYGINLKLDPFCQKALSQYTPAIHYDNPDTKGGKTSDKI